MSTSETPFAIDIKWTDALKGADYMLHVRAQDIGEFARRLLDAATLFPSAGITDPTGPSPVRAQLAQDPPPPLAVGPGPSETRTATPKPLPPSPHQQPRPNCPDHGPENVKESKFGGLYCTAQDDDDQGNGYCKWTWGRKAKKAPR